MSTIHWKVHSRTPCWTATAPWNDYRQRGVPVETSEIMLQKANYFMGFMYVYCCSLGLNTNTRHQPPFLRESSLLLGRRLCFPLWTPRSLTRDVFFFLMSFGYTTQFIIFMNMCRNSRIYRYKCIYIYVYMIYMYKYIYIYFNSITVFPYTWNL